MINRTVVSSSTTRIVSPLPRGGSVAVVPKSALVQTVCDPIFGPSDELKVEQWPGFWV